MKIGFIKLHRSLVEWQYWDDHNTTRLLIYLLVSVNFELKKWRGIEVKPGSIITSYEKLAIANGLSISQIRRSLTVLENDKQISRKTTNKNQLVSLVKWDELQIEKIKTTGKQQTKEQLKDRETTTTKEGKETKEERILSNIKILDKRKKSFSDTLNPFINIYGRDLLNDFYKYWTEPNKSMTKLKFEFQNTWSIELRLSNWEKRNKNFKQLQNGTKPRNQTTDEGLRAFLED